MIADTTRSSSQVPVLVDRILDGDRVQEYWRALKNPAKAGLAPRINLVTDVATICLRPEPCESHMHLRCSDSMLFNAPLFEYREYNINNPPLRIFGRRIFHRFLLF